MKPTTDYIRQRFDKYNQEIFGGKLPVPAIALSQAKTYSGQCSFKTRRTFLGKPEPYDFKLRFSVRVDYAEEEFDDILIHEMIHYYIGYFRLSDTSSHGPLFRRMMAEVNARHGRHLSVTHHTSQQQAQQAVEGVRRWHVVALVHFDDGRTGIKVLPRTAESIMKYHHGVLRAGEVTGVDLYLTDHPYFNRFPVSSAFRVHFPNTPAYREALAGAERLTCNGQHLWMADGKRVF